jgi:hypothetical protein
MSLPMLVRSTFEAVYHIAQHMREMDKREVYATRWTDSPETLAAEMSSLQPSFVWTAKDGEPVYAFAMNAVRPGVWTGGGFGTDRWPEVMRAVSKHLKGVMVPLMLSASHRIECCTLAEKIDGHRWLRWLGAEQEAVLHGYGRGGEDYLLFTWRA